MDIVIAGGGAAGFFAAIACAEAAPASTVHLLEKSPELLAKVTISGGGRCNVTHACFDPRELATRYPRGGRELIGAFARWQGRDTVDWFTARGVALKTEDDGRMFPVTDRSTTITGCLEDSARRAGVRIHTRAGLAAVERGAPRLRVRRTDGATMEADRVLIATGGNVQSGGFEAAAALGHTIEPPVPSLFTFHVDDPRLRGLSGLSSPSAVVRAPAFRLEQRGPMLVTHWGLSGPAILRLSAWGARAMHDAGYAFELRVNWTGQEPAKVLESIRAERAAAPRRLPANSRFHGLPSRLWASLLRAAEFSDSVPWAQVSNDALARLARELSDGTYAVRGRSLFKDEFVTCGGVARREVDFRTMESRVCPGVFFAGEVLDIDGITGGFNLQAAWTTGRLAGLAMAGGSAGVRPPALHPPCVGGNA